MSSKVDYKCDVCGHAITDGHQEYYMARITVEYTTYDPNDSTEHHTKTYHAHNDFSNHCTGKIWDILEKNRK